MTSEWSRFAPTKNQIRETLNTSIRTCVGLERYLNLEFDIRDRADRLFVNL